MAGLAQLDLRPKGGEARIRALLEDLAQYHKGVYPRSPLALFLWFQKSPDSLEHHVLELFNGLPKVPKEGIVSSRFSLLWKTGSEGPPFVNVAATSVDFFTKLLANNPEQATPYQDRCEVLYFDKALLSPEILETFRVLTEPSGLLKGWYITDLEYSNSKNLRSMLSAHGHVRPEIGLVKTEESADFENCRGFCMWR